MTRPVANWCLLAYDVRDRKRLQRLHYRLKKQVAYLQESVALVSLDEEGVETLLEQLSALLDPRDDLRIYRLDGLHSVWLAGPTPLPGVRFGQAPVRTPTRSNA